MPTNRTPYVVAAAWFLFLVMMIAVAIQDFMRGGGTKIWQPVLWETSSNIVGLAFMLTQRRIVRKYDYLTATPVRWFALQLSCLPLFWIIFVPFTFGIRHGVYALVGDVYSHQPWGELFVYESIKVSIFYTFFMVILFGILSYHELLEEKLRAEKSNVLLRQAQLQRLTQQMHPHFLFNALNTVSSLMHEDVDKADATLVQLADALRATLEVSDLHVAPLATELRLVRGYSKVMEERYPDRVSIAWHIEDAALKCEVAVMSLQPLLENVFKHTVEQRRGMTNIAISATCADGMLTLAVQDDAGKLGAARPAGIGLRNLRERLDVLHNGAASLEITQCEPAGVCAEMRLPCAC